jgi:hypothetical protein
MSRSAEWHAVRCIFELPVNTGMQGAEPVFSHLYEERITLWRAASGEDAIALAEQDAARYCADGDTIYLGIAQTFELFDSPTHGVEVFSLMRDSDLSPDEYVSTFFSTGTERQTSLPE